MRRPVMIVGLLLAAAGPASAQTLPSDARFTFEWAFGGGPVGQTTTVQAGTPITLQVLLRQTAGSTNVLAAEGGLFGGSVRTTFRDTGAPSVLRIASLTDVVYNPQFNDTVTSNATRVLTDNFAEFRAVSDLTQAATADANGRVLIGTFTFQAVGAEGTSTILTAGNIPNTLADTVTFTNFFELDRVISPATLTVNVVPVPEPSGLFAVTAAAAGLLAARRRRRAAAA